MDTIINKVAESALTTIDLKDYFPPGEVSVFDIKNYLFRELILKEKEFRSALQTHDWTQYKDKNVAVTCSTDAIIPMWAYMLVATYLQPEAREIVYGTEEKLVETLLLNNIRSINGEVYLDKRVVVKGCGDMEMPESAYLEITKTLRPFVKSIMYGEPCSTVPIFKRKQALS